MFLYLVPLILLNSQLISTQNASTTPQTTTTPPPLIPTTHDYIIRLVFGIEIEKIPDFILDTTFNTSNNVTVDDIIKLYHLADLDLNTTVDVLDKLHYKPYSALSIEGLERFLSDFDVQFKDYYNAVFLQDLSVTGLPLRKFLIELGVNTGEFSDAITFGDPDPLEVFKRGNFTEQSVDGALKQLGRNKDELFEACKKEVLNAVRSKSISELIEILKTHNFDRVEAKNLWSILDLQPEDVGRVEIFGNLLDKLIDTLENETYLGVLTSDKVAVNKKVYTNIKNTLDLSKIYAQSLYDYNTTVELVKEKNRYENIVTFTLATDNFTDFIQIGYTNDKYLNNCQFITIINDTLTSFLIQKVTVGENELEIDINDVNITDLIQGSPLICDDKVYGLAKEMNDDEIVFDNFAVYSNVPGLVCSQVLIVFCLIYALL